MAEKPYVESLATCKTCGKQASGRPWPRGWFSWNYCTEKCRREASE